MADPQDQQPSPQQSSVPDHLSDLRIRPASAAPTSAPTSSDTSDLTAQTLQQARTQLPQPPLAPPWEDEPRLPTPPTSALGKAYQQFTSFLGEHERHFSEAVLAPFRQGLDNMAEDLQRAGETGHTKTGGVLTGPARAFVAGAGEALRMVPVGKDVKETVEMSLVPPELSPEAEALATEIKAGKKVAKTAEREAIDVSGVRARPVTPNASGESAASQEAINRVASEKAQGKTRVSIDTRSGKETPLIGADAVDVKPATPYHRIVERSPKGEVVLAEGAKARPMAPKTKPTSLPTPPELEKENVGEYDLGEINTEPPKPPEEPPAEKKAPAGEPEHLYHVTYLKHLDGISSDGLQPGRASSIGGPAYQGHKKGKVFLSDEKGVSLWTQRAVDFAYHNSDDLKEDGLLPVVTRVPKNDVNGLEHDEIGSRDSGSQAFAAKGASSENMEVWNGKEWESIHSHSINPDEHFDDEGYLKDTGLSKPFDRPEQPPVTEPQHEPVGLHEDDLPRRARYQDVDFSAQDLQDSGKTVTADTIRKDYAGGDKNASIYKAHIPMEDLPSPQFVKDEDFPNEENFDRGEYSRPRVGVPIKVEVDKDGKMTILDGNHRAQVWSEQDHEYAPAWVVDRRGPNIEQLSEDEKAERAEAAEEEAKQKPVSDDENVVVRRGEVKDGGAYFSSKGESTYYDPDTEGVEKYHIGDARVADTNDEETRHNILREALRDKSLTAEERRRIENIYSTNDIISYMDNDELPLPAAAKRLGYDGIKVWENDDITKPSSIFMWNTDKAKKLGGEATKVGEPFEADAYHATSTGELKHGEGGTFFSPEPTPEYGDNVLKSKIKFNNALKVEDQVEAAQRLLSKEDADKVEDIITRQIPLNEIDGDEGFRQVDQMIAKAAREKGHDGIVYTQPNSLSREEYVALDKNAISKTESAGTSEEHIQRALKEMQAPTKPDAVAPKSVLTPEGGKALADKVGGKVVGSVATGKTSPDAYGINRGPKDLDIRVENFDKDKVHGAMKEAGFEHTGSHLVSPKEAKESGKEYPPGWNRADTFKNAQGHRVEVWRSEPAERDWEIHDLNKKNDIKSEPGYVYHATNAERAQDIANEGLKIHRPWHGTDQSTWPDGSTDKRSYFTDKAHQAWQFAPEDGKPALLRMKQDPKIHQRESTGDFYSKKKIDAGKLEVLGSDQQWHSMAELRGEPSPEKYPGFKKVYHGTNTEFESPKPGSWLTESPGQAAAHGKNVKEFYIKPENPVDLRPGAKPFNAEKGEPDFSIEHKPGFHEGVSYKSTSTAKIYTPEQMEAKKSAAKELPPQPRLPDKGTYAAIKTDDGGIYHDTSKEGGRTHIQLAKELGIPPERVVSGGWLRDGEYEGSERSDAGRWGEQARAQKSVEAKRAKPQAKVLYHGAHSGVSDSIKKGGLNAGMLTDSPDLAREEAERSANRYNIQTGAKEKPVIFEVNAKPEEISDRGEITSATTGKSKGRYYDRTAAIPAERVKEYQDAGAKLGKSSDPNDPEFKKWFEGSKVVDKEGKPLTVYHGTDKPFSKVNMKKGAQGIFWVSSDKDAIARGDVGATHRNTILPAHVKITNPAGWDEYHKLTLNELEARGYDGVILPHESGEFNAFVFNPDQVRINRKAAIKLGKK